MNKIKQLQKRGFNLYQVVNAYYKKTRTLTRLPESVVNELIEYALTLPDEKLKSYPYMIRVVKAKGEEYHINRQLKVHEEIKKDKAPINVMEQLNNMFPSLMK